MKHLLHLPLYGKVLIWLSLHMLLFGLCFFLFVNWQLGLGLDSLLSGAAGERMKVFGDEVVETLVDTEQEDWDKTVSNMASKHGLTGMLVFSQSELDGRGVPDNVQDRVGNDLPPRAPPVNGRGPGQGGPQGPGGSQGPGGPQGPGGQQGPGPGSQGPGSQGPGPQVANPQDPYALPPGVQQGGGPSAPGTRPGGASFPPSHSRQGPQGPSSQGQGFSPPPHPPGSPYYQQGQAGPNAQGGQRGGYGRPYPPPHMRQGQGGPGQPAQGQYPGPPNSQQGGQPLGQPPGQFGSQNQPGSQGPQGTQGLPGPQTQQGAQMQQGPPGRFRSHGPNTLMHPHGQHLMDGNSNNATLARNMFVPETRALFLTRGEDGDGYWAGVTVHFPPIANMPMHPAILLLRSDTLDGGGMFFDFKPWLKGAIAILILSMLFWTPFVWNITRYLRKLTAATDEIAAGRFDVTLPTRSRDELGTLGETMQTMSKRLDQMVSGQKRFLADAAHELCGPLARIRTGLGIMEARMEGPDQAALQSIDTDVEELAGMVDEVLSFSRAGRRKAVRKRVLLREVAEDAILREGNPCRVHNEIAEDLLMTTDPTLVGRCIGNLVRNASIHAGHDVTVTIKAEVKGSMVELRVEDDGPGVPSDELEHLFQPFYRLDQSRNRDTGGSGLGLAIVQTSIQACHGEVKAYEAAGGGFGVLMRLPKDPPKAKE